MAGDPAMWTAVGGVAVAAVGGFFTWRNSRTATGPQNAQVSLQWAQQAHAEATEAKAEAKQAKRDAESAEETLRHTQRQMDQQARRLDLLDAQTHELMDWISRVLLRAQQVDETGARDPKVAELLRVINGGPASMSGSRLRERNP